MIVACTGCTSNESGLTPTPDFVTATLSAPQTPQATSTIIPKTPVTDKAKPPILAMPIEGITTTEINIRAQPSTASAALGAISIFTKVQIIGRDSTGSWYQITYADSAGWVRAEYVQVDTGDEIPVVTAATRSASGISALVIQKINVRKGPGTNFEALGTLNPNDVIFIIGKDQSGAWVQIEFANAPDGKGWAAIEFLKIDNADSLPIIGTVEQAAATPMNTEAKEIFPIAMQDSDSMQAPLATAVFSPTSAQSLQLNGDVSAPNGDTEDWIQFASQNKAVVIQVMCTTSIGLHIELLNGEIRADDFLLSCGEKKSIAVTPNEIYYLRISEPNTNDFLYTSYTLKIESAR